MVQNKSFMYNKPPVDWPKVGEHISVEKQDFDLETEPPSNGITTKNFASSFDPYMRGRMRDPSIKSYSAPFEAGKPLTNATISKVIKSNNSKFQPGDLVIGFNYIQEYSIVPEELLGMTKKLENPYKLDPATYLGALGMPGLTAYSSYYEIGQPKKGETIFISAASGAVGAVVGQLAKHDGLTVIGSVGSDDKLEFITKDLGFDGGFNYKKEAASDALKRLAPKGIDIYYENVGGEQLEAAIGAMNNFGRIIACGMISQYNVEPSKQYGVKNLMSVVGKRLRMQGFIVGDENMGPKYTKEHQENVAKWIHEGTFKAQMHTIKGIDNAPDGLIGMYKGENFGKTVLKIADIE